MYFGVWAMEGDEDLFIAEGRGRVFWCAGRGEGRRDQERVDHEMRNSVYEAGLGAEEARLKVSVGNIFLRHGGGGKVDV